MHFLRIIFSLLYIILLVIDTPEDDNAKQIIQSFSTKIQSLVQTYILPVIESGRNINLHITAAKKALKNCYVETQEIFFKYKKKSDIVEESKERTSVNNDNAPLSASANVVAMHIRRMKKCMDKLYSEHIQYYKSVTEITNTWSQIIESILNQLQEIKESLLNHSKLQFQAMTKSEEDIWHAARHMLAALVADNTELKSKALKISKDGKDKRTLAIDSLSQMLSNADKKVIKAVSLLNQYDVSLSDLESLDRNVSSVRLNIQ